MFWRSSMIILHLRINNTIKPKINTCYEGRHEDVKLIYKNSYYDFTDRL